MFHAVILRVKLNGVLFSSQPPLVRRDRPGQDQCCRRQHEQQHVRELDSKDIEVDGRQGCRFDATRQQEDRQDRQTA
jgi:hypothetical protein